MRQGGGVGERVLTPSYENTKVITSCSTVTDKNPLRPTKRDTLQPKTTEEATRDGRRGIAAVN